MENTNDFRARPIIAFASGVSGAGSSLADGSEAFMQEFPSEEIEWQYVVTADAVGGRLDGVLAKGLAVFSRSRVKDLIVGGAVSINGETVEEPKHKLKLGDVVVLVAPEPVDA